ncbi:LacI family DNA-binding transcriptional regulator [Curtobacterium sp. MCLR17_036]|uniref:LacI family DNA-binding transcriptional regulator n=1 Tax=Curtobacterium sp. MCLR17_036 TaxID=2175620 RepID=UPI000DA88686|nr:LacI family DNA-binding transcriptional regulator [Curtobacterium sp. MCLR17_036]WIE65601.1 LacI family DNA-binding transcriptional regulator [Curtobacterium sp. MCLR17_036]
MTDASIDDVAAAAGVHRSTVSRAFSNPTAVRAQTREHVLRVAAELGYSTNPLAQALRRRSSTLVPLVIPDITNPFFAELARATAAAAELRGYQLVLCVTENGGSSTAGYVNAMQAMYSPFGIVAPSTRVDLEALRTYGSKNRVVVLDRVEDDPTVPTVTVDSRRGVELAFEHLALLGHRAIAYAPGIVGTYTAQDRHEAYEQIATGHGTQPLVLGAPDGVELGAGIVDHWLAEPVRATAIIASNDAVAFAVIAELESRGHRVPDEVSVVGFDGLDLGAHIAPRLTSVRQPIADLGRIAVDLGEGLLDGGPVRHEVLQPTLLLRSSTAGPRS